MTTLLDAPPGGSFRLGHSERSPRLPFSATLDTERLDEKYRPTTLAEVLGQSAAVRQLESFLSAPTSTALLFEGESGVGKTSAARALANDLGVDPDWGFEFIKSAEADMDAVERALRMLRHVAPGSGWKMCLVDEADLMTPKASHLWLSALENLPSKSVVVFTTNRPQHFPDRFLDRCERVQFESDGRTLKQDAQALVDDVWKRETGDDDAPSVDDLPNVVDSRGVISFRRAVMALNPLIRAAKRPTTADGSPSVPIATRIDRMETTLDRPVKPTADGPGRPAVASRSTKPANRPSSARKRPQTTPAASKPAKQTSGLARLRNEWNDLVALDESLSDQCVEIDALVKSLKAERESAPPSLRRDVAARLEDAYREMERLGNECFRVESRMAELKAAMGR